MRQKQPKIPRQTPRSPPFGSLLTRSNIDRIDLALVFFSSLLVLSETKPPRRVQDRAARAMQQPPSPLCNRGWGDLGSNRSPASPAEPIRKPPQYAAHHTKTMSSLYRKIGSRYVHPSAALRKGRGYATKSADAEAGCQRIKYKSTGLSGISFSWRDLPAILNSSLQRRP